MSCPDISLEASNSGTSPPPTQGFRAGRGAESRGASAMVQGQSQAVQGVAWGNRGAPQHSSSPHRGRCPSRHGAHVTNIQTPHPASAHTHFQNTAEPTISSQSLAEDEEAHRKAAEPMAAGLAIRGTAGGSPGSCPRPGQETSLQSLRYHPQGSQLSRFHNTLPQSSRKNTEAQALHPGTESAWGTAWASGVFS